jgi:hypothetical protein
MKCIEKQIKIIIKNKIKDKSMPKQNTKPTSYALKEDDARSANDLHTGDSFRQEVRNEKREKRIRYSSAHAS